jgi:small multidrug resistance family-3 protein
VTHSILLFVLAAIAEIGGAWLIWQGVREHRGWIWMGAGIIALGIYGFVATLQPDARFGRILAAYSGILVAGFLAWGEGRRPPDSRPPDQAWSLKNLGARRLKGPGSMLRSSSRRG